MPTLRQLSLWGRGKKKRRCEVAALKGAPHRRGVVTKMGITTPRKPNSAKRRYARVRVMASKKLISAHPPGIGPAYIQEYSLVLVEGGSPPDTPGINYSLVRGVYDFCITEEFSRRNRRSKFGAKRPNPIFDPIRSLKDKIEWPKNIIPVYHEKKITPSYLKKMNALQAHKDKLKGYLLKHKRSKIIAIVRKSRFKLDLEKDLGIIVKNKPYKRKRYFNRWERWAYKRKQKRLILLNWERQEKAFVKFMRRKYLQVKKRRTSDDLVEISKNKIIKKLIRRHIFIFNLTIISKGLIENEKIKNALKKSSEKYILFLIENKKNYLIKKLKFLTNKKKIIKNILMKENIIVNINKII